MREALHAVFVKYSLLVSIVWVFLRKEGKVKCYEKGALTFV